MMKLISGSWRLRGTYQSASSLSIGAEPSSLKQEGCSMERVPEPRTAPSWSTIQQSGTCYMCLLDENVLHMYCTPTYA